MDKHFVVTDENDRVIGGLCYKVLEDNVVLLDGSAITSSLQGRGLGSAMVEDFFTRMATNGVKVIKAHFLLGNYYLKHNSVVDIIIFDSNNRVVKKLVQSGVYNPGPQYYPIVLNVIDWEKGRYCLRLIVDGSLQEQKYFDL